MSAVQSPNRFRSACSTLKGPQGTQPRWLIMVPRTGDCVVHLAGILIGVERLFAQRVDRYRAGDDMG